MTGDGTDVLGNTLLTQILHPCTSAKQATNAAHTGHPPSVRALIITATCKVISELKWVFLILSLEKNFWLINWRQMESAEMT